MYAVSFCSDDKRIISASCDKNVKFWDIESKKCIESYRDYNSENIGVYSIGYTSDGKKIAFGEDDNSMSLWNLGSKIGRENFIGHK